VPVLVTPNLTSLRIQEGAVVSSRFGVGAITVSLCKGFVRASGKGYGYRLTLFLLFNILIILLMGLYLTIGILTKIKISKERAKRQASATPEDVKKTLLEHYNKKGIYNLEEDDYYISLKLKPEIAEPEMIDFLNDFYELRYSEEKRKVYTKMEEIEQRTTLDEWLEYASEKDCSAFQLDEFIHIDTPYPGGWTGFVDTSAEQIILSLDGKIIMECYGELFLFFTNLIKDKLSKYKLADSLKVAISG
jgi:hypothetical protein